MREVHNELTITLTGLHPFTTYNISVRGRPKLGHHWSEREWTSGKTDATGMLNLMLSLTRGYINPTNVDFYFDAVAV